MARAAVATQALDKQLDSLSKRTKANTASTAAWGKSADSTADSVDRLNSSMYVMHNRTIGLPGATNNVNESLAVMSVNSRKADGSINQLTGRLRVFADVAAMLGPALSPIGAVGAAGIGGIVNQLGVAVLAGGSAIVAFQGVGDALKLVNAAALEPTTENLAKANAEMAKLSPAARDAVQSLSDLRPTLLGIRDAGAEGIMPGFTTMLDSLADRGPEIANVVNSLNSVLGDLMSGTAASLDRGDWDQFFNYLATDAAQTLEMMGRTVGNLTAGLGDMWMAFDPVNDGFSRWLLDASESFAAWSEGLSSNRGFQEFVDYVMTSGPQVAATFGALGGALLDVMVAAAPLGGPVLAALEAVAKVVSSIAESDIGTPIMLSVAALAAFNRTAAITASLSTRMGGGGVLGMIAGTSGGKGVASSRTAITGMRRDLSALAATYATAGARTSRESARMAASAKSLKSNLGGVVKGAAPAGAALAGLALISSGAADDIGLTNTASLALMGTMAGPWGALGGAVAGAMMDASAGMKEFTQVAEEVDAALGRLSTTHDVSQTEYLAAAAGVEALRKEYADLLDETESFSLAGAKNTLEGLFGRSDTEEASERYKAAREELQELIPAMEEYDAKAAEVAANDALIATANETATSFVGLGESVNDAEVSLGGWLKSLEEQNRALRNFRINAEEAGRKGLDEGLVQSLREAGPEGALRMAELANASEREIGRANRAWRRGEREIVAYTASVMGVPPAVVTDIATRGVPKTMGDIDRLVAKYKLTEEERQALITVTGVDSAISDANRASTAFDYAARTRTANILLRYSPTNPAPESTVPPLLRPPGKADGGTIEGQRWPYGDKVLLWGAPGEEVITNRNGEADRFRQDRAAGRIPAYANGGTIGAQALADGGSVRFRGREARIDGDWVALGMAVRLLNRELKQSERAFRKSTEAVEDLRSKASETGSRAVSQFEPDLFAQPSNPWAAGSAGPSGALGDSIAGLRQRTILLKRLSDAGLKGDAYSAAMEGSNDDLTALLAGGKAGVSKYQRQWNTYSRLQASTSSQAGKYAYGDQIRAAKEDVADARKDRRQANQHLKQVNERLDRVEKAVNKSAEKTGEVINKAASTGQRNRKAG